MRRTSILLPLAVLTAVFAWTRPADASPSSFGPDLDKDRFVIGPGVAYAWDSNEISALSASIDVTYATLLFWGSAGFRSLLERQARPETWGGYVEAGGWLVANVGLGYGFEYVQEQGWSHAFQAFVGFPVPVALVFERATGDGIEDSGMIVEPFVRPQYFWGADERFVIEAGLLLKYSLVTEL